MDIQSNDISALLSSVDELLTQTGLPKKKASPDKLLSSVEQITRDIKGELHRIKKTCKKAPKGCSKNKEVVKYGMCEAHAEQEEKLRALSRVGKETLCQDGFIRMYDEQGKFRLKHRIVMEEKLKRPLLREEEVAFLDGDKTNCSSDNLMIRTKSGNITCPSCNHQFFMP